MGIANNLFQLRGIGLEYLLDSNGIVIAKFFDGNLAASSVVGSSEKTVGVTE